MFKITAIYKDGGKLEITNTQKDRLMRSWADYANSPQIETAYLQEYPYDTGEKIILKGAQH